MKVARNGRISPSEQSFVAVSAPDIDGGVTTFFMILDLFLKLSNMIRTSRSFGLRQADFTINTLMRAITRALRST